ncbi:MULTISPECIES: DUF305 domain-containing protein [unclassified Modestobacter]|uniref:DUF305 domain-containing protein n=1 Tax=unclassified Modestobacter TaxID=2643866 RepID=UPI0022AB019C|nr:MULTISPECIES: DUF305 domain-containing protein [unclassified Modestobacter]MCZ2827192.1 DUF305 domain-containing protein [Modestobacter sp. VKM Ac-2981]MCZ2854900.1 DUF305 domain-containing protein [Modestobacter sp. VKM Ac-2982]
MTRTNARLTRLAGGLAAAAVVLAGCSDTVGPSAAGDTSTVEDPVAGVAAHNDADVAFAQGMIPHHEGALMMAEAAVDRASDSRVVALAERIEAAQGPEIDLMTGWLEGWGEALPESGHMGGMGGMDHGSEAMGSGMGMEQMPAAGPDFDRRWLKAMVEHHEGAVEMAQTEVQHGRAPEVIDLARTVSDTQRQEIEEMEQLLTELDG